MLPPYAPEVAVEIASPRSGATPKQPIMGRSGTCSASRPGTSIGVAVPPPRSSRQSTIRFVPASKPGSSTCASTGEVVKPVARLGVTACRVTASASPGSAPSTWKGPVCGLPRGVTGSPAASWPCASTVEVTTVSPSAIDTTGSCVPRVR